MQAWTTATRYSPQQLASDLHALRESLEEAHASLYRYHDKRTIDAAFDAAASQLDHELGEIELYGVVTAVLAQISDGHTAAYLSGPVRTHISKQALVFPLRLRFVAGHIEDHPTAADLVANRDVDLAATLSAIAKRRGDTHRANKPDDQARSR